MAFDLQVHKTNKDTGEIVKTSPYILLMEKDGSIYVRDGRFWFDDGTECPAEEVPEWANKAVEKLGNACRAEVGLPLRDEPPAKVVSRGRTRGQSSGTE